MDSESTVLELPAESAESAKQHDLPRDILAPAAGQTPYEESDVFAWANNLVQFKDELKIDLFLINKNYVLYKTNLAGELHKQLEPIFIDEMLEYVLNGAAEGLIVRGRTGEGATTRRHAYFTCTSPSTTWWWGPFSLDGRR